MLGVPHGMPHRVDVMTLRPILASLVAYDEALDKKSGQHWTI